MSSTEGSSYETGTEYTESTADTESTLTSEDTGVIPVQNESSQEKEENNEEEHKEEVENKPPPPPPEPEIDPLEGITYDDDPSEELPQFGELSYWEDLYQKDQEATEWYLDPHDIKSLIEEYGEKEGSKVLVPGNGTSVLAADLAKDGFESVVAFDFSPSVIKKMRKLNRGENQIENLSYKVIDARDIPLEDASFSMIVDKATLDCVFHLGEKDVMQYVAEVARLLQKKGVFLCVSNIEPKYYRKFFDRQLDLMITLEKVEEIKKPLPSERPYYVYVVRKVSRILL